MEATQPSIPDDVDERVEHALMVERVLTCLGWFVLLVGVASSTLTAWQFLAGEIDVHPAPESSPRAE